MFSLFLDSFPHVGQALFGCIQITFVRFSALLFKAMKNVCPFPGSQGRG